jgi:hypothetical protein
VALTASTASTDVVICLVGLGPCCLWGYHLLVLALCGGYACIANVGGA